MKLPRSVLTTLLVSLVPVTSATATDWVVSLSRARDAGLQGYWQTTLPMLPGEAVENISVQDRQVYVSTSFGVLHAIAADSGLVRWTAPLAEHGSKIFTPQNIGDDPQDGFVLVTTVSDVYILGQLDGNQLVKLGLRLPPSGPAATNGDRIFVGGNNGWLHAIPLNDGKLHVRARDNLNERLIRWDSLRVREDTGDEDIPDVPSYRTRWVTPHIEPPPYGVWALNWSIRFNDIVPSPPAILGDQLYVSSGRRVFCMTATDKQPIWSRDVRGAIAGPIVVSDDGVFVSTRDNSLVCFDADTGKLSWRYRMDGPCSGSAVLLGDAAYQATEDAGLYAIDVKTGLTRWNVPDGRELLSVDGDTAFVRIGSSIFAVDRTSGRIGESVRVPFDAQVATNFTGPGVFAATTDGVVLCLMPKEVPYLRAAQVRRELRRPPAEDAALDAELKKITKPSSESLEERHPLDSSEDTNASENAEESDAEAP